MENQIQKTMEVYVGIYNSFILAATSMKHSPPPENYLDIAEKRSYVLRDIRRIWLGGCGV